MTRLVIKALLVLGCLAGAGVAGYDAGIRYLLQSSPQSVLALRPSDPQALTLVAEGLFLVDQQRAAEALQQGRANEGSGTSQRQLALARRALRQQVLSPRALRQIGMALDQGRIEPSTRPYMELAEKLSRRELVTQLWLAQDDLKANHLPEAVGHLDTVFRTSVRAREVAWPLLLQAGELPGLGPALAGRSDLGAQWVGEYLQFLLQRDAQIEIVADTLETIRRPAALRDGADITAETALRLALNGEPSRSRRLFEAAKGSGLLPEHKDAFVDDGATSLPWALFGWSEAASEWRGTNPKARLLDLYADGGARRTVARQVRFDPPGRYRWSAGLIDPILYEGSRIEINLRCSGPANVNTVWLARSGASPDSPTLTATAFTLNNACPAQVYSLDLVGADGNEALTASLKALDLQRIDDR